MAWSGSIPVSRRLLGLLDLRWLGWWLLGLLDLRILLDLRLPRWIAARQLAGVWIDGPTRPFRPTLQRSCHRFDYRRVRAEQLQCIACRPLRLLRLFLRMLLKCFELWKQGAPFFGEWTNKVSHIICSVR